MAISGNPDRTVVVKAWKRDRKLRFFLGPLDVCGLYSSYTVGLRTLGYKAEFLDLSNPRYSTWNHRNSALLIRLMVRVHFAWRHVAEVPGWRRWLLRYYYVFISLVLILWVAFSFDVAVFKSGETITGTGFEIWLYRKLRVRIIAIFHGSDSRPPFLAPNVSKLSAKEMLNRTLLTRARTDRVRAFADVIVDNPLSAHNQTGPCCIYQVIGNSVGPHKLSLAGESNADRASAGSQGTSVGGRPKIVHAPSNPELKGTALIRDAMAELREEGHEFEYYEISGKPVSEVMHLLANADLVIDELYSDIYGGVFAQEACCFGCPVIVGGYGLEDLDRFVPEQARLPTLFVHPDQIKDAVREMLVNAGRRCSLSQKARRFISEYGDYRAVAARLVQLADGTAPASWFFDPSEIRYVAGIGGSRERIRESVHLIVSEYGPESLLMDDKAALRQALLNFVDDRDAYVNAPPCSSPASFPVC